MKSLQAKDFVRQLSGFWMVIFSIAVLSGCVATTPFPNAARSGDTLTLAVGSADGMTRSNTTVDFYPGTDPSAVTPIPVPIRSVAKIYPDKTSDAWLNVVGMEPRSGHGHWLSIVVVDLPSLPVGQGIIRVTSNGEVTYPRFTATPNGMDIPMEILNGQGNANPFDYYSISTGTEAGDLSRLEEMSKVEIKPQVPVEGTAESMSYGAIEISVNVPISVIGGGQITDDGFSVVLDDMPQHISRQTNLIWKRNGNDFTIMLTSPLGMYGYQSRVSIVPALREGRIYQISGTPTLNSITYYDLDGAPSSGPLPTLSVVAAGG